MACFEHGTIVELAARETVALPDVRSAVVRVTRGTLWITQEGDPQDVVLHDGDTWAVEHNGLTVVEAQSDANFCVMGRHVEPLFAANEGGSLWPAAWARTRDAFAGFFNTPTRGAAPYY